jgi:hypothetical protein
MSRRNLAARRHHIASAVAGCTSVVTQTSLTTTEIRLQAGEFWQAGDLVFANDVGRYLTPDQVRRALLRALRDAGLPRIRPHDLRHTHASVLLRLRTPMKVVQERLGHSSYAITADIYSHVAPDLQEQAAGVFGAALHSLRPTPPLPVMTLEPPGELSVFVDYLGEDGGSRLPITMGAK